MWAFLPQTSMLPPRTKIDAPTVIITRVKTSRFLDWRIGPCSNRTPTRATVTTVSGKAATTGKCAT